MAAGGTVNKLGCDWELLIPSGPNLAFHTCCFLGSSFYIHGGITKKDSRVPSCKMYRLDLSTLIWNEVLVEGGPALSHHASIVLKNRYWLMIGGWDGKVRSTNVFAFDSEKQRWLYPNVSGFPEGGGLSSHTATLMGSGEILILGREGGLRTQRRHGDSFILSGDVEKGEFRYSEYTTAVTSRSGHTTNVIGSMLYIVGGRDDKLVERLPGSSKAKGSENWGITSKFVDMAAKLKPVPKLPCGRKNHIAISGPGVLFMHGGDTFDGRSREPVGEMYIMTTKPTYNFCKIGVSEVGRSGHVCATNGEKIFLHGGVTGRGTVMSDTFQLQFL